MAFVTPFSRPLVMPVSLCIEERTGRMICMYEFKKDPNDVTEMEWIQYFKESLRPEHQDYTAVDEAMKKLRVDLSLPDADSRMGKLRADMHRILDQQNVEEVMVKKEQRWSARWQQLLDPMTFAMLSKFDWYMKKTRFIART
ncbi:TPA: hypothetical protein N0F65_005968 [Lagenidium giganteum]|uniref:Uncharacterized protein n=1 Tax=Lagenidium giganteum TaxID=4803 RepID=A0AAV2Z9H3_9STRA|nr:TPA: hypothetical protein N0F65_005968 [Lagenidium giganteum]